MKYQLDVLYRLIAGDLSPQNGAAKGFNEHIDYLQHHFKQCIKHYKVYFKQDPSGNYAFQYFNEYSFIDLAGLPSLQEFLPLTDQDLLQSLITESLLHIPIAEKDIIKAQFKKTKKEWELELITQIDFAQLQQKEARYYYYYTLVYEEVERIKKALTLQFFQLQSQKQIKRYIQNHQLALEKFSQSLLEHLEVDDRKQLYSISKKYTLTDIYKTIFIQLGRLQQYIESHFTRYLDINGLVPYRSRLLSSIDIDNKLSFIYPNLLESDIDSKLLKIIDKPLQKLAHIAQDERITYKGLLYHKMLFQELFTSIQNDPSAFDSEAMIEILYRLNYNSIDFFHYISTAIEKAVAEKQTHGEKKIVLYHFQKIYRQQSVKINSIYQHSLMPLNKQALTWLKEEIYYLEKTAIQSESQETNNIGQAPGSESNKIIIKLSVAQLAYFLRVMYEVGLISVKSQWDIFRFLKENFSSKRKEIISTQSLNNKYYNVEESTKTAIKDVLIKMLNYINKSK